MNLFLKKIKLFLDYKNDKGSVSPFFIIVMTALLLLIFGLIDFFRISESKNQLLMLGMIGINSVMSDYNKELKEDYDLEAFVYQNYFEIENEIINNVNKNINGFGINKMQLKDVIINDSISLNNKNEIIRQIKKHYMDEEKQNILELFFDEEKLDEINNERINVCSENEYNLISSFTEKDNRDEIMNKINTQNEGDIVIDERILNDIKLSEINFEEASNSSKNIINKIKNKINFANDYIIDKYIFEKFSYLNHTQTKERTKVFDSEIEFIICGSNSQNKNIQSTKDKILLLLFPEKLIEVYSDAERKNEAELIAQAVCGWWASEIGVTITKNAILNAWALDMANDDYIKLTNDEEIFFKLINKNVSYKDMLSILLMIQNEDKKIENMIKLIDINMKKYNYNFSMDTSYAKIKIELKAKEKFLFMTRKAIPNEFRFDEYVDIEEECCYGY